MRDMIKSVPFPARIVGLALVTAACAAAWVTVRAADAKVDVSKLPPPAQRGGLTFEKDVKPILEKSCVKCHSGQRPKGKYDVLTRENMLKGGREGEAVRAGKSAESPLIHYVAGLVPEMEMPPTDMRDEFPALTKDQIALLRAWIDQGAK
jgi:hypothetical protein